MTRRKGALSRLVHSPDPIFLYGNKLKYPPFLSVQKYNVSTGTLHLQHAYPPGPNSLITAVVDVDLLLSTLQRTDTQVGEWQNVVGYVQAHEDDRKSDRTDTSPKAGQGGTVVKVQAVMLWSAGSLKIGEYEKALEMRKKFGL
ncbi:MAG: hypothetical protein Q9212_003737 [Teloschistes hypoglaucus]